MGAGQSHNSGKISKNKSENYFLATLTKEKE